MARLFFAVWPDAESARALALLSQALAERSGGKPVPREKIHMTLAFLGTVEDERRAALVDIAARVQGRAFALTLDHAGSFRRAGVAWAGTSKPPQTLLDLQSRLESALRAAGFEMEERPFAPHVTLARRTQRAIGRAVIQPRVSWRIRELTLVRSETGTGRYVVEERWKLGR